MSKYNVRKIEEMGTGIKGEALIASGYTHYLCAWNSDATRNSVVRPYKSKKSALKTAEKYESMIEAC